MKNLIRTWMPVSAGLLVAGTIAGCASKKEVHIHGEPRAVPVSHETHYDYDYDHDGREVEVKRRIYHDDGHDHQHIEDVEIDYDR